MRIPAILWDGFSKIEGELVISDTAVDFDTIDFRESDLKLHMAKEEIVDVEVIQVFHSIKGIRITTKGEKRNEFIIESGSRSYAELLNILNSPLSFKKQ